MSRLIPFVSWIAVLWLSLSCFGCERRDKANSDALESQSARAGSDSGSGDVGIISPAAGGLSPVVNSDAVVGQGGGGVGQVIKEKAKGVAANPPSSLNQGGDEGN